MSPAKKTKKAPAKKKPKKAERESFESIARDIKSLKIQGASKVEAGALKAFSLFLEESKDSSLDSFKEEIKEKIITLAKLRPTEPKVRKFSRTVLHKTFSSKAKNPKALKKELRKYLEEYWKIKEEHREKIVSYGAKRVPDKGTIFTYCHSNTVEAILKRALEEGKKIKAICCETRPLFQGRITATNLSKLGIPVTLIVDGAANSFIRKADMLITGADAILGDGGLVNKVGTSQVSMAAREYKVSHYVACSTLKFDAITIAGMEEPIEERDPKEIWDKKPKGVTIRNPAFDITPAEYIKEYITEKGLLAPEVLSWVALKESHLNEDLSLIKLLEEK